MKTFIHRSGMTCVLLSLAMAASAMESGPTVTESEPAQPAAATYTPFTIVKHGAVNPVPAAGPQPGTGDAQSEQGDSETNRLQIMTAEQMEQTSGRMKERLADPAQRPALRAEQRALIQQQYGEAGRVLGLDEATAHQLIELLTDQQMDKLEKMYEHPGGRFDLQLEADATTRRMQALRDLLDEGGLDRYERYGATLGERRQVDLLSARLGAGDELRPDQKEHLISLLHERTRQSAEDMQRSRWMLRPWQPGETPSFEQMQRASQLSAIATTEESWRRRRVTNREIETQAAAFLAPTQLAELSKWHTEEQDRLRQWIESQRAQVGMDPKIPEHAPAVADAPEQPRIRIDGQVQVEIRLTVNRAEPRVVTRTVRNGESFTFEAADGLIAEATPTLYEDHWLDLSMTYYEQGTTGKRRLPGGGTFGVMTRLPDGTPGGGGGGGSVISGRKGYAINAMVNATAL